MNFLQKYLFNLFNAIQAFNYVYILYLTSNLVKTSRPEKKPLINSPLMNDPEEKTIKVIKHFLVLAEKLKNGNIDVDRHLFLYRSCQYKAKLKVYAVEAVEHYSMILENKDKINTQDLRKVLELQKFIWEAESCDQNPMMISIVYNRVLQNTLLFNLFLSKKKQELLELPTRIHLFNRNKIPTYLKFFLGSG
ncbi:hypothetical protein EDEG_01020 [Edhazardia aedis USNM 41457]|uniref:Uncharacterized protein n=1 Tax=Edhazardia aedis (strain USNM 41457) TaxID=1003232 RepID=J8ZYP6_EDHAE|nr:hypothetical protein EDEG_01020 [Edhazardia aedis USNM 41457]|eukprot:EJW04798.1 hypothetical protein EDEG_01020 [Edhazardia aedis USNM 41457]